MEKLKALVANSRKTLLTAGAVSVATVSNAASAALDQTVVDGIVGGVTSDAAIAIAAGFTILAVVLGGRVGFSLVKSFIASGAS